MMDSPLNDFNAPITSAAYNILTNNRPTSNYAIIAFSVNN